MALLHRDDDHDIHDDVIFCDDICDDDDSDDDRFMEIIAVALLLFERC